MAPASLITNELRIPELTDTEAANDAFEQLRESFGAGEIAHFRVRLKGVPDEPTREVEVPSYVLRFVTGVLGEIARGHPVTVGGIDPELTTQQAADLLKVSRPYLVKLLDEGKLPHRRVGNRRKVLLADLLDYQYRDSEERRRVLDDLTREAEDLGLDY